LFVQQNSIIAGLLQASQAIVVQLSHCHYRFDMTPFPSFIKMQQNIVDPSFSKIIKKDFVVK
jgi:hypothetical protein